MGKLYLLLALSFASTLLSSSEAEQRGSEGDVGSIMTPALFEQMLKHRDDVICPAKYFYTYDAFISAANSFPGFGTTGDLDTRKREIAAFFAQSSHETGAGWPTAPDGPYAWGYCFKENLGPVGSYCVRSLHWPCVAGKKYYERGPLQISYNYNYGPAGQAIGVDLLSDPDRVATDPVVSFQTALWFWMTPQFPKPSCHDAITGGWTPSAGDLAARRLPGYGVLINILNGHLECGHASSKRMEDRMGYYRTFCSMLGVSPGDNVDCYYQIPFGWVEHSSLLK